MTPQEAIEAIKLNEIIVPLKCLVMNESDCRHCKLKDKNDRCEKFLYSDVLGLIDENNRQKADIDRQREYIELLDIEHEAILNKAIQEFAERLKTHTRKMSSSDFSGEFWDKAILVEDIDNLVKEMVGAESG